MEETWKFFSPNGNFFLLPSRTFNLGSFGKRNKFHVLVCMHFLLYAKFTEWQVGKKSGKMVKRSVWRAVAIFIAFLSSWKVICWKFLRTKGCTPRTTRDLWYFYDFFTNHSLTHLVSTLKLMHSIFGPQFPSLITESALKIDISHFSPIRHGEIVQKCSFSATECRFFSRTQNHKWNFNDFVQDFLTLFLE